MRSILLAGAAFLSLGAAQAAPVQVAPLQIGEAAQEKFAEDYGTQELSFLERSLRTHIERELKKRGAEVGEQGYRLEVTLVGAKPSRPTFKQLSSKTYLDFARSRSLGGAEFQARFLRPDGSAARTFAYRWYETDLRFSFGQSTWYDAQRAIDFFSRKVGQAYSSSIESGGNGAA